MNHLNLSPAVLDLISRKHLSLDEAGSLFGVSASASRWYVDTGAWKDVRIAGIRTIQTASILAHLPEYDSAYVGTSEPVQYGELLDSRLGLTAAETAAVLGIKMNTLQQRIHREKTAVEKTIPTVRFNSRTFVPAFFLRDELSRG